MSTVDTGSRLTCLAVVPPDNLLIELNQQNVIQELSSGDKSTLSGEEPLGKAEASEKSSTPQTLSHKETYTSQKRSYKKMSRMKRLGREGQTLSVLQDRSRRKALKKMKYNVTNGGQRRTSARSISGRMSKRRLLAYKKSLQTRKKKCVKEQLHTQVN